MRFTALVASPWQWVGRVAQQVGQLGAGDILEGAQDPDRRRQLGMAPRDRHEDVPLLTVRPQQLRPKVMIGGRLC